MRLTRVIAISVIAASLSLSAYTALQAQTLRNAGPPAEFPPQSYKGKQYVDSRGCIYIRAGIDGATTWVPRVSRERKVVCGYKPSLPAGSRTASAAPANQPGVEQITLPPSDHPAAAASKPAPKPVAKPAAAAPARTAAAAPSPAPVPKAYQNPPPAEPRPASTRTAPVPVQTVAAPRAAAPSPGPEPTVYSNPQPAPAPVATASAATTSPGVRCANASDFSQRYINDGSRHPVRCGPQTELPYTVRTTGSGELAYVATSNTRVVPRHVYDNRQNTQNVAVPPGYAEVWQDDRLNPKRAERTLAPYKPKQGVTMPEGYRMAWSDDRLNTNRGGRADGDAQTGQIWSDTVPRKLNKVPTDRQVVQNPNPQNSGLPRARTPTRSENRQATQQQPARSQPTKPQYIRVATYNTDADARASAKILIRKTGLPVRLGTLHRKGKTYRVVMAGPFTTDASANAAMGKVRGAGYSRARLSK